jgi:uncharacterized membrane protein YqjE
MGQPYFVQYRLKGIPIDNPIERNDVSIQVDYEDRTQGSIETSQLTFVNEAYNIIKAEIEAGRVLEGLPLTINIQEGNESTEVWKGYLDYTTLENLSGDSGRIDDPKFLASIVEENGLNSISERLEGVTFALLESNGLITSADYQEVKYLVEKQVTFLEQAFLALSIYLMVKEVVEAAYRLADQIATIASLLAAGAPFPVASFLYAIASAIFEALIF